MRARVSELVSRLTTNGVGYARGPGVKLGEGWRIDTRTRCSEPSLITVGDRVTGTGGEQILTHDGGAKLAREDDWVPNQRYSPARFGCVVVGGLDAGILRRVTIGDRIVVGAGSVVTKDLPGNTVVVGDSTGPIKTLANNADTIRRHEVLDSELATAGTSRAGVTRAIQLEAE